MLKAPIGPDHDPVPGTDLMALAGPLDEAVLLLDGEGRISYANDAATRLLDGLAEASDGAAPADGHLQCLMALLPEEAIASAREHGRWSGEILADDGRLALRASVHPGPSNSSATGDHLFVVLRDTSQAHARENELQRRHSELRQTYVRLAGAQEQLLQSEKMASIGQLAAGVAHEINNPIGYVHSNLGTLQDYVGNLFALIDAYDRALRAEAGQGGASGPALAAIDSMRARVDLEFITRDLPQLLAESREGIDRVCKIVRDLKDFSYSGRNEPWREVDLLKGLDSTLNIVWNDLKYKATLEKHYTPLPPVECLPSEINQVFMNILLNAGHAIGERGTITLRCGVDDAEVWIGISDTGTGIAEDALPRIFDPFFTTKPVGLGTGLGLSISYGIIAKHHGRIEVASTPGQGSDFRIVLPIRQPRQESSARMESTCA